MSNKAVVVDDDRKVVMLVEKALKDLGFEVFTAEDGSKALELVKKEKPGILISDMLMPGLHGAELCDEVRSDPELKHIKIILMTAVYKESNIKLDMNCDANGFLEKPVSVKAIVNMVGKVKDWSGD